jgi:hypothetical protein
VIDLEAVFGYPEGDASAAGAVTLPDTPEASPPETSTEAPGSDFSDWIRRQDCKGRMGWEPPGLPEEKRWWADCNFDELPEADAGCPERLAKRARRRRAAAGT